MLVFAPQVEMAIDGCAAAPLPPLLFAARLRRDLLRDADCRVSTYPDCDPLIRWAVLIQPVMFSR